MARFFLEDAGRAADVEDGELLEFFGDRRDREAAARGHVADDHVNVVALDEVAELGDDIGSGAAFVDEFRPRSWCRRARPCCKAPARCPH